jgi:EAL domain-containing protein (putative c-di-GMP-specific phosphodiesterase class I)
MTVVLVVDDEPSVRRLLRDILEMEGYDVRESADGPSALESLAEVRPDCVVLDVMMPGMTGIEVLAALRADDQLMDLPVMMLTAATDDETTWSGWSAGANYYLPKPFDVEELLKWVDLLVSGLPDPDLLGDVDIVLDPFNSTPTPPSEPGAELFRLMLEEANPIGGTPGTWQDEFDAPLRDELERALRTSQIWVAYQPIVAMDDDHIVGVEALARWRHPQRGDLAPSEFVPLAEKTGLGDELGHAILAMAAQQVSDWNTARVSIGVEPLLLAVNVSGRQLTGDGFLPHVLDVLATSGLPPELLVLEVDEALLAGLTSEAAASVERIAAAGVRLSLDDFGAADASISYLHSFPVDFVKVDRSFIRGIGEHSGDEAVIAEIVSMAHRFGRAAVAEGVETEQQAEWLRRLGCEYAQGFHFGYPAPAGHLNQRIVDGRSLSRWPI